MTNKLLRVLPLVAIGVSFFSTVFGQDARVVSAAGDKYVISARAGGVNYTEGRVVVARLDGRGGQLLKGDEIQIGDRIATGADGRAEILLNPGSYMRVDKDTEFSFVSTSLDDLRLKLNSGSAVFEVIADDDFRVSVRSPKSNIDLVRSGVYRIDVSADGSGKISVWKGTAFVGSEKTEVKPGRSATVTGDAAVVAKFDREEKDPLDFWSKERAKELTKINAGLERKVLRNSLLNSFNRRGWDMYNSFGLWVFDPMRGFSCFMPFGYGWGSPYGYGYGYDFWTIGMPQWVYYQPPLPGSGGTPLSSVPTRGSTSAKISPQPPDNGATHGRFSVPPFMKIERSVSSGESGGGAAVVNRRIDLPSGGDASSPVPTRSGIPSSAREPISTAPAPTISVPNRSVDGGGMKGKQP